MAGGFNPYQRWLGVSAEIHCPNHYELLGLRRGEDSTELIQTAAFQRSRHVESFLAGERGMLARQILDEIAAARDCLLDRQARADYDRQLSTRDATQAIERPLSPCPAPPPGSVAIQDTRSTRETRPEPADAGPRTQRDSSPSPSETALPRRIRPAPRTRHVEAAETPSPSKPKMVLQPVDDGADSPRVPMTAKMTLDSLLEELITAMRQCRQLYTASVPTNSGFLKSGVRQFVVNQDRLHRGLLAKIYATIAQADGRRTIEEQRCAAALLQHFGVQVSPDNLAKIADDITRQAGSLQWRHLLRPFHEIPEMRCRIAELQAVVVRLANLIAKSDGFVAPGETAALHTILEHMQSPPQTEVAEDPRMLAEETRKQAPVVETPWDPVKKRPRTRLGKVDRAAVREERYRQLEALVGLREIKQQIHDLADNVLFHSRRRAANLPYERRDLQFVFVGSRGTGKTHVARLLSELLFGCGGLKYGQLVEVSGFDLVSCEAPVAAGKMKGFLKQAVGGTLLINDADAILLTDDSSAVKALHVLCQNLAAHAGKLSVVLASDRGDHLLALLDQRAEISQRFRSRWQFADYSTGELGQIFQVCCDRSQYRVTRLAQIKVLLGFHWCLHQDRRRFGNGHGVQRVFEQAVGRLARRIAGISPLTKELLTTFHDSDIRIEGIPAKALANLDNPQLTFAITCPGCATVHLAGRELLGVRVECKNCQHRFVSAWGEPMA